MAPNPPTKLLKRVGELPKELDGFLFYFRNSLEDHMPDTARQGGEDEELH